MNKIKTSKRKANLATKLFDAKKSLVPCNENVPEPEPEFELPDKPNELMLNIY